ncbi:hypothetical protein pb186bvf_000208 [Paramecium bursaria]
MMRGGVLQMKGVGQINKEMVLLILILCHSSNLPQIDAKLRQARSWDFYSDGRLQFQLLTQFLKQRCQKYQNSCSQEFQDLIFQICLGLQELHSLNIIHKSISSDNIVVNFNDNQLKFVLTNINLCQYDQYNRVLDTPLCIQIIPPELACSMPCNEKVDIWSFGCLIYKLITKNDLFKEPTQNDTLELIKNCEQGYIDSKINTLEIDEQLKNILKSMICVNIEDRLNIFQAYDLLKSYYKYQGGAKIKIQTQLDNINQQQDILNLLNSIEEDAVLNKISKIVKEQDISEEIQNNIINKLNSELINFFSNRTQLAIQQAKSQNKSGQDQP